MPEKRVKDMIDKYEADQGKGIGAMAKKVQSVWNLFGEKGEV